MPRHPLAAKDSSRCLWWWREPYYAEYTPPVFHETVASTMTA